MLPGRPSTLEQEIALYGADARGRPALHSSYDSGVICLSYIVRVLWLLGYPDQAAKRSEQAITLARGVAHQESLV
jgi:adenylate cyclase